MRTRIQISLAALAAALGAASPAEAPQAWADEAAKAHCRPSDVELLDAAAGPARAPGDPLAGVPPLYDGLGAIGMEVTTTSPRAQDYFDQGLALAWGFNHGEAIRSFRAAQAADPSCAMCFWGEAFAWGPNINAPMPSEALASARTAVAQARALAPGASSREQALIAALALRYDPTEPDALSRETAWADALGALARDEGDDATLWTLHAEALMNRQPWNYWAPGGRAPKGRGAEIVAALERALAIDPAHPGAAHFYIHAVEASADPGRAEPYADRLGDAAPTVGHLVHMPSHIYVRTGRYADAIAANRAAVAADESLIARMGEAATPMVRFGYYPHNIHFLLVASQLSGAGVDALAAAEKLGEAMSDEVASQVAFVQAMKTALYAAHSLFSDPETVLALPEASGGFPYVEGFRRYARGLAEADRGALDAARAEAAAIRAIAATADLSLLEGQGLPARDVLAIAANVVEARAARAGGDPDRAEALLREAAALQDGIPYMEPPYWHYPVRQSLAATLLEQGRAAEAASMFERALAEQPNSGWALSGLAAARRAAGDEQGAAEAEARLAEVWTGDRALLAPERL